MEENSRKKIEKKEFKSLTPKKREPEVPELSEEKNANKKVKQSIKFIRVSSLDKKMLVELGLKVSKGEVKWSYYAIDGDVGYHYFASL